VNLLNDCHIVLLNTSTKGCFTQYFLSHNDNIFKPAAYVFLRSYLTSLLLSVVTNKITHESGRYNLRPSYILQNVSQVISAL